MKALNDQLGFTCLTGTKVQTLTQKAHRKKPMNLRASVSEEHGHGE
jgi:hypothetical protein